MEQNSQRKHIEGSAILLPHSVEAERSTIGAMLLEKNALYEVMDFLKPDMFYDAFLGRVYQSILNVEPKGVDLVTVLDDMKKDGEVDIMQLVNLSDEITSSSHISVHARIVYQDYVRRNLIISCAKTMASASDMSHDVSDLINSHMEEIDDLSNKSIHNASVHVSKVAVESLKAYDDREAKAKEGISTGRHTGLKELDMALHGFQTGVYILAARPAMGKTAFMLNIARKTAKTGTNVLIFSLEMTKRSLVDRMVIAESGVNASAFRAGRLQADEYINMALSQESISVLPIMINDSPSMSVQQIKAEALSMKRKKKCDLIMIDYLQLMSRDHMRGKNTNDEVSAITRAVKIMSKDLDVPVILLSQLSRESERRADKVPMLSDLRDSGAIEQDADVVMFIHREAYYTDSAPANEGIIRIAKSREERTGDVHFYVNDNITDFRDEVFSEPISNINFNNYEDENF